jgi:pimeloyl-ACP methyl ester carboxylesterase
MTATGLPRLDPLQSMRAGVQEVAYYQAGRADGDPVLLLHGFSNDIHSYEGVSRGWRPRRVRLHGRAGHGAARHELTLNRFTMSEAAEGS